METLPPGVRITSPMPRGNGAFIAHRYLERHIPGYALVPFDPRITLFPPLLRAVRCTPADIIHTVPDYAVFHHRRGVPLVVSFQNYVLDEGMREKSGIVRYLHNRLLLRRFTRAALDRAAAVTAVSRYTAELVRQDLCWQGPIRVIYNGIDTERFHPAPEEVPAKDGIDVLFSGNMTRRKGFHLLPGIIRATRANVRIWYTAGLRTRDRGPRHERLCPLGSVAYDDMPALYRRMDVLLMPTAREGLSLAVAEAMASGLPVVATDCSSLPEMVVEGEGGYLCPYGDARCFAERIDALAADPALRRRMGAFNRARAVELFDQARMVAGYRALFGEVLGEGQA